MASRSVVGRAGRVGRAQAAVHCCEDGTLEKGALAAVGLCALPGDQGCGVAGAPILGSNPDAPMLNLRDLGQSRRHAGVSLLSQRWSEQSALVDWL